ncbi:MAG: phage major capsid protein [Rhizobiales bacterium]|nr:phage major capsid protein [Hyphomicrobiales bacterium]
MKEGSIPRPRPAAYVWRAAAATVRGFKDGVPADVAARALWPDDQVTPIILRGPTGPAVLTDPNWAGPLAFQAVSAAIEEIVAMSAIGRIMQTAFRVDLGRNASVLVPGRVTNAADAGQWVAEGAPIPVRQLLVTGAALRPRKVACIVTMTRELIEASNIEDVVRMLLTEAAGLALDAAVFSTSAGTTGQPAGILNGVTAVAPVAGGGSGFDACGQDLGNLVKDIATRAGGRSAFFIGAPAQATAIRFWAGGQFGINPDTETLPVEASAALADGTVVCIEAPSLAITLADPEFEASKMAAVHQEDTAPTDIVSGGAAAVPVKSMFQIDATALRMTLRADWAMRAAHVSYLTGATW